MFHHLKFGISILLFFLFGLNQTLQAQEDKLSSKLNEANNSIYSNPEKAIILAQEVYNSSEKNSDFQLSALITLGTAYSEKFDMNKSIESLLQALEIAQSRQDYVNQVRALSLLGYQYQIMQINDKTHNYLDQAELIMSQHALPDSLSYLRGNNYSIKALTYQQTLDCDYAVEYFNKAISVYKKLKNNDISKTNLGIGYLNKAICFLEDEKSDSAKASLIDGDKILKEIQLTNDISISQEIAWAKYYLQTKDHPKSIDILNKNLEKAKTISQLGVDMEIYQLLSKNYLALNDIENYNHFSNLYIETQKKFSDAEKKSITHIINKPPGNSQNGTDDSFPQMRHFIIFLLASVLILILIFGIKSYRLKKKIRDLKSNHDSSV